MLAIKIFLIIFAVIGVNYLVASKCILTEFNRYCIEYAEKNTLFYVKLRELEDKVSLKPSFLLAAYTLIRDIEKEKKSNEN